MKQNGPKQLKQGLSHRTTINTVSKEESGVATGDPVCNKVLGK
jgi:hypothetical protein